MVMRSPCAGAALDFPICIIPIIIFGLWSFWTLEFSRGLGRRMHCCVEITESSTNKQHHLNHDGFHDYMGIRTPESRSYGLGLWKHGLHDCVCTRKAPRRCQPGARRSCRRSSPRFPSLLLQCRQCRTRASVFHCLFSSAARWNSSAVTLLAFRLIRSDTHQSRCR